MSFDALALTGSKGGGSGSFRNVPDNLRSTDTYEILLGLGGVRTKLAPGGLANLMVDDVPVEDGEGNPVFEDFSAFLWDGDPSTLKPVSLRLGQSGGQTSVNLGLSNAYTSGAPGDWSTAAMTTPGAEFIDLRFVVQSLYKQTKKGVGNQTATIQIELRPSGATNWINPLINVAAPTYNVNGIKTAEDLFAYGLKKMWETATSWKDPTPGYLKISGKTTSPYIKELRIAVPSTGEYANKTWQVRCRLIERDYVVTGEDGENEDRRDIIWESIAGVSSDKIGDTEGWRGVSYVQIYGKATDQISGLPEITGIYDLGLYQVPPNSVWNPSTRVFTGATWDGVTNQMAWTQCPAWQIKGLIEDGLSGISALAPGSTLNKWDALEASKWFAELVPDGRGGQQPRYSLNWFIEQPMQTHELVNYLAGAVGGRAWDEGDGRWRMKVEKPESPQIIFTKEMIEGEFVYSHTDIDSRFNDFTGSFRNKDNRYEEDRVRVWDQLDIDYSGRRHTTVALVGCDNRQEALRRLMIRLLTSINETRMVTFVTNRLGATLEPLSVIAVADGDLNSDTAIRSTGRVIAINEARTAVTVRDTLRLEVGVGYKAKFTIPNAFYDPDATSQPASPEWRKPTTTIERSVVNTSGQRGDITTLYFDTPLPANLPEFAPLALEAIGLPALPKQYRVTSITPSEDGQKATISAVEIYTSKWAESDAVSEDAINNQLVNRIVPSPVAPTDGMFEVREFFTEYGKQAVLVVAWERPASRFIDDYRIEYTYNGGPTQDLGRTRDTYFELPNPVQGEYVFRIFTRDRRGAESKPLVGNITLDETLSTAPIYSLTNHAALVHADAAGNVSDWSTATGSFELRFLSGKITSGVVYSVASTSGGLTITINENTGYYVPTALISDSGTALLRAEYQGQTFELTYSIAKVRAGAPGEKGEPGDSGIAVAASLSPELLQASSFANGNIATFAGLSTTMYLYQGAENVGSDFSVTVASNPHNLTTSITGRTVTITGAGTAEGEFGHNAADRATLTIRATGSGPFAGLQFDKILTLTKLKGGFEIFEDELPTTDNFEGRTGTFNGKLYTFTDGAWSKAVDGADITGGSLPAAAFAANIEPITKFTGTLPSVKTTQLITNTATGTSYEWRDGAYRAFLNELSNLPASRITGQVTSTQIGPGEIKTPNLEANSVTTDKMVVAPGNMIANGAFGTGDFTNWKQHNNPAVTAVIPLTGTTAPAKYGVKFAYGSSTGTIVAALFAANKAYADVGAENDGFVVEPGQEYRAAWHMVKVNGFAGRVVLRVYWLLADGSYTANSTIFTANAAAISTSWTQYTAPIIAPEKAQRGWFYVLVDTWTAGDVNFTNFIVNQKASAELIVDGSIRAFHLGTESITTAAMLVTGRGASLTDDPNTVDITAWLPSAGGTTVETDTTSPTGKYLRMPLNGSVLSNRLIQIDPTKNYSLSMWYKQVSGSTPCYLAVAFYDKAGAHINGTGSGVTGWLSLGTYFYFGRSAQVPPSTWTEYSVAFGPDEVAKIPANAAFVRVGALPNYSGSGVHGMTGVKLFQKADANLIVEGNILTKHLATDSVDTRALKSGAVQTQHLDVTAQTDNLIANPKGAENAPSSAPPGWTYPWVYNTGSGTFSSQYGLGVAGQSGFVLTKGNTVDQRGVASRKFRVQPGKTYSVKITMAGAGGGTATGRYVRVAFLATVPPDDAVIQTGSEGTGFITLANNASWPSGLTDYEYTFTVPSGQYWASLAVINYANGPTTSYFTNVEVREQVDSVRIGNGAVVANHLAANSVTANAIAAGQVTAAKMNVTQLSAISANLGAVNAGSININNRFIVNSDGTTTIQTSATGQRAVTSHNGMVVYDAAGTMRVRLGIW